MGDTQSTQQSAIEDVLTFLEEEVKKWDGIVKNLRESWRKQKGWVPVYLKKQLEETETRWMNIKSLTSSLGGNDGQVKYPESGMRLARCCQEVQRKADAEIHQLKKNIDTLLRQKNETELELKEKSAHVQNIQQELSSKGQSAPQKPNSPGNGKLPESGNPAVKASLEENVFQIKYPGSDMQLARCCQEVQRKAQTEINQLKKNNDTLLRNKNETELELKKMKEKSAHVQNTKQELSSNDQSAPSKPNIPGDGKLSESGNPAVKRNKQPADDIQNQWQKDFLNRMLELEDGFEKERAQLQRQNQKLATERNSLEKRVEALEQRNSDLLAGSKEGLEKPDGLETEGRKQHPKETVQQRLQLSGDKECENKEETEATLRKPKNEMGEKYVNEKLKNEELTKEKDRLQECIKRFEKEKEEMLAKSKSASENIAKDETERQRHLHEEEIKKHGKQTGRDSPVEALRKKCRQMENEKLELLEQKNVLEAQKDTLETYANQLKEEKDELLLRLSKFAGDKLVENNPAITDLSDPNRPTKLAEFYSELYDNEWTNAFEALEKGGYDEVTAIETLRLTLQNVLQFCESKADLLLQKASDAVNLLFEEYRLSVLEMRMPSHLTMPKQQARDVGQFLRREKSSLEDIKLQRMWEPSGNNKTGGAKTSGEKVQKEEHSKLNAENKLKQLRKDMASTMVPIVQKAYIEASWTNRCIDELKPYILKCLYLGWMMVVQSPPMVFHKCPSEKETKFDKNFYKEYTASGPLVSYIVWPALLLKENGPLVCKGVAEGKKP